MERRDSTPPQPAISISSNPPANENNILEADAADLKATERTLQVLLVDDDTDINHVFKLALTGMGYACDTAISGKQALLRLANSRPDIVLLDMRLGIEIDGSDILYQIRSNPRFDQTRVVIITAYPTIAEQVSNLADLVLIKPVTIGDLKVLLGRLESTILEAKDDPASVTAGQNPFDFFRDPITGLYNRNYFYTRLEHAMESARRRPDSLFATFVLGFDPIISKGTGPLNGHRNTVLRQVAERLRLNVRPSDAIARLSRSEFATLHEGLKRPQDTSLIMERVDEILAPPYQVDNDNYYLDFSLGAVIHDRKYSTFHEMMSVAQETMQMASQLGNSKRLLVTSYGDQPVVL